MEDHPPVETKPDLAGLPLDEMCEVILERHHAYLHGAIPVIRGCFSTLADRQPVAPALVEARAAFAVLSDHLLAHLAKEENILFPALAALAQADREGKNRPAMAFPTVLHPIRLMESEHVRMEAELERIRLATNGFVPTQGSSDGWRRCVGELARFDEELRAHLRVENDVLFPRALDLERRLP